MTYWRLIFRNFTQFRNRYLAVVSGMVISTAVLTGALMVGDSVNYSLSQHVFTRLGKSQYALETNDRYFTTQLANNLSAQLQEVIVPMLSTQGIAINPDQSLRINQVQLYGIDERFSKLWEKKGRTPGKDEVAISRNVANKLAVTIGDELLLKLAKEGTAPSSAPFAATRSYAYAQRFKIIDIYEEEQGGGFNLKANQADPYNLFVQSSQLQRNLELRDRTNILLVPEGSPGVNETLLDSLIAESWNLLDVGMHTRADVKSGTVELSTDRIFFDTTSSNAIRKALPLSTGFLTYLANAIATHPTNTQPNHETPYSFVTATDAEFPGGKLQGDEIVVNQWLADDLNVKKGDSLFLNYYLVGPLKSLKEGNHAFVVKEVIPMDDPLCDSDLMPDFPGLSSAGNCRDWETGTPIDLKKIRDKDENYWKEYRGTPKAFISLETGIALWSNKFGRLTSIRYQGDQTEKILSSLSPENFQLRFQPVRQQGMEAASHATDFGGLFLGLSFFVILSGLLLSVMIFSLQIQSRTKEIGLFSSLGFSRGKIFRFLLMETLLLALISAIIGSLVGTAYNYAILWALSSFWQDAVRTSSLTMLIKPSTLLIGMTSGAILSIIFLFFTIRKFLKQPLNLLLRSSLSFKLRKGKVGKTRVTGLNSLIWLNMTQNKRRLIGTILLLTLGTFTIVITAANRRTLFGNDTSRTSGTGGFLLWAESTIPIQDNLQTMQRRVQAGLPDEVGTWKGITILQPVKVVGDDASCLNLNRIQQPSLVGINARYLDSVGAFSFENLDPLSIQQHPWRTLMNPLSLEVIPGFADQTVIQWGLQMKMGDTLVYQDEYGRPLKVKLMGGLNNSIFQGNLLISDSLLNLHFPSASGGTLLLIDAPPNRSELLDSVLSSTFEDHGMVVTTTAERLALFNSVQNTYLMIFLILGGLGVLIGTIGFGFFLMRTIQERSFELALYQALGFPRRRIFAILFFEHFWIFSTGILLGIVLALLAALPSLLAHSVQVPWTFMGIILVGIWVSGILWIYIPLKSTLKKAVIPILRKE